MKNFIRYLSVSVTLCCLVWPWAASATLPVKVLVSIMPQKYFVERIGGKRVAAEVLVRPGKSPEHIHQHLFK